jgi:hypothetical protein
MEKPPSLGGGSVTQSSYKVFVDFVLLGGIVASGHQAQRRAATINK